MENLLGANKKNELLEKALEVAGIGFWEMDLLTQKVTWSPIKRNIMGVAATFAPTLPKTIAFFKHGEHRQTFTQCFNLAVEKGQSWDGEFLIETALGQEVWIRSQGEVEFLHGRAVRVFGVSQNIDQQKRMLLENETASLGAQVARVGSWELDVDTQKITWSNMEKEIFGLPHSYEPTLDDVTRRFKAGEHRDKLVDCIQNAIDFGASWNHEFLIIKEDGQESWIRARGIAEQKAGKTIRILGACQDINERKLAQLRKDRLALAIKEAHIGIWEYFVPEDKLVWDDTTLAIYEEIPENFKGTRADWLSRVHPDDLQDKILILESGLGEKDQLELEYRIVTPTKKVKHVKCNAWCEFDNNGTLVKIYGLVSDYTQLKKTQLKNEKLALAVQESKIGIWEYDPKKDLLYWDENTRAVYGVDRNTFQPSFQDWEMRVHPEDLDRVRKNVASALAGEDEMSLEYRILTPEKEIRHVKHYGCIQYGLDKKPEKVFGIKTDITDLIHVKLELTRSQESFAGAFEYSSTGMALVDLEGQLLEVNKSILKSIGYSKKELLELNLAGVTHPEDLANDLHLAKQIRSGKRDSYQIEKRFYHKNGHLVYALSTVTGVNDVNGALSHYIVQLHDITERIEAEEKLERSNKIMTEQNDSLLNFAHIVSHNLRSHSTNMAMLLDFYQREKSDEERAKIIDMMTSASGGLNETVNYLNEIVQINTTTDAQMKSISVLRVAKKILDDLSALIQTTGAKIELKINKQHFVLGVPAYLDSILLNLVTNALKYASPKRKPKIIISTEVSGRSIFIRVEDNGLGIDLKQHGENIFGMFKTFHRHQDAKGIGLYITRNQVEAMQGKISVTSKVDKGSVFKVELERPTHSKKTKDAKNT